MVINPHLRKIEGNSDYTYWVLITLPDTAEIDSAMTTIFVRGYPIAQHAIVSLRDGRKVLAPCRLSGHFAVDQTVPSATIPRPPTAGETATALPCYSLLPLLLRPQATPLDKKELSR